MVQKLFNLKQKILRLYQIRFVSNVSKDISVDNMKKTGLNGYVYDLSFDYHAITVDDNLTSQVFNKK